MTQVIQKDSSHLAEKLEIRRRLLRFSEFKELRVLDLCAGQGVIWKRLREQFPVTGYTPCDRKPRMPGCIKMEISERALNAFNLSRYNVIDVDTYGDPWLAWDNIARRATEPTVVFLTHGAAQAGAGGSQVSGFLRRAASIPLDWDVPRSRDLSFYLGERLLRKSAALIASPLVVRHPTVRYYGLLLGQNSVEKQEVKR